MNIDKRKLTVHIIIGMIAGIVCGIALNEFGTEGWIDKWVVDGVLDVAGKIFLKLLTVLVVPLVFVSLVCGTAALNDIRRLGRVGLRTVLLYLGTTAAAISLAIVAAVVVQPGAGFDPSAAGEYVGREMPSLKETVIGLVPGNIVKSMAEGNMLPIIFFAVLFGMALVVSGEQGRRIGALFEDANEVIMNLVFMIMLTAPYGVFALVARTFANEGLAAILPLGKYFFLVIAVLVLHAAGTLTMLVRFGARVSPLRFFRNIRAAQLFAFSTASSNATLPVTLDVAENRAGIRNSVASFVLPLGATINMDGTAIMQGVATVFIAQAYHIQLGLVDYLTVIFTATLASIGTAGVPGVGLIMLMMVLRQVGLPVEGIALIIGIDRLLDMVRTAVNVTGDLAVATIVARSEGEFDEEIFEADNG